MLIKSLLIVWFTQSSFFFFENAYDLNKQYKKLFINLFFYFNSIKKLLEVLNLDAFIYFREHQLHP
jgi:hypothetical protein